jgi:hypothetical protein
MSTAHTLDTFALTIANGASLSGVLALGPRQVCSLVMPASWTAAPLSFQASLNGTDFFNIVDSDGAEVLFPAVAASQFIPVPIGAFGVAPFLRLRSGTSAAAVNQGADRTITLLARFVA